MRKRNHKRVRPKRSATWPRARQRADRLGPMAELARDLAARIQGSLFGHPPRMATARAQARVKALRANASRGTLVNIADRMLAMKLPNPIEAIQVALLRRAMIVADGNITAAARLLGIHRKAVERLLTKHDPRPRRR